MYPHTAYTAKQLRLLVTEDKQACNVCKITPINMNELETFKKEFMRDARTNLVNSALRSYLKIYEFLLHIAAYNKECNKKKTNRILIIYCRECRMHSNCRAT